MTAVLDAEDHPIASYAYDLAGRMLQQSYENHTFAFYKYDEGSRLTTLQHFYAEPGARQLNAAYVPSKLASFSYGYDQMNHRVTMNTGDGQGAAYGYDRIYRLTQVHYPDSGLIESDTAACPTCAPASPHPHEIGYTYDLAGNRLTQTIENNGDSEAISYQYLPGTNELASFASTIPGKSATYSYDAGGNLSKKTAQNFIYDAADHLVQADKIGGGSVSYTYDGDGKKIMKTVGSVVTAYVNDGLGTLVEFESGHVKAAYINGANGLVKKLTYPATTPATPVDELYYHQDGLGSTCMLTDKDGRIVERYQYDPFGQVIGKTGILNKHTFTGKEEDDDIGLTYFTARWLDSEVGRFTQVDPLITDARRTQDFNQYVYVRNDPINELDPTGKNDFTDWIEGNNNDTQNDVDRLAAERAAAAAAAEKAANDAKAAASAPPSPTATPTSAEPSPPPSETPTPEPGKDEKPTPTETPMPCQEERKKKLEESKKQYDKDKKDCGNDKEPASRWNCEQQVKQDKNDRDFMIENIDYPYCPPRKD